MSDVNAKAQFRNMGQWLCRMQQIFTVQLSFGLLLWLLLLLLSCHNNCLCCSVSGAVWNAIWLAQSAYFRMRKNAFRWKCYYRLLWLAYFIHCSLFFFFIFLYFIASNINQKVNVLFLNQIGKRVYEYLGAIYSCWSIFALIHPQFPLNTSLLLGI